MAPRHRHQLLTGLLAGTAAVMLTLPPDIPGRLQPQQKCRLLSAVMLSGIRRAACRAHTLKRTWLLLAELLV